MNIIYKTSFNGKKDHPHLIELSEKMPSYMPTWTIGSREEYNYKKALSIAKDNAIPFREEDAFDVNSLCMTEYEWSRFNNGKDWQPDLEKVYSIEGEYKIKDQCRMCQPDFNCAEYHQENSCSMIQKFAVLLKEETVKEKKITFCSFCGEMIYKEQSHICSKMLIHKYFPEMPKSVSLMYSNIEKALNEALNYELKIQKVKEPEKIESQDKLWRDAREELIIFIRDNEERILSMPTPMAFDIINFLKSKFHIGKPKELDSKARFTNLEKLNSIASSNKSNWETKARIRKAIDELETLSEDEYFKLIGVDKTHAIAMTIWDCLMYNNYRIIKVKQQ